jgi:hypothetical protein
MYKHFIVPLPSKTRKPRPQTHGILHDKMCKSLGGLRMPISIAEGNRWPHDPMQAMKFASEAGVVVRHQVPILTHWKHYKKPSGVIHYKNFVERLTVCMGIFPWHSTLLWTTLTDLLFIHITACSQGWTLTRLTHQHKKFARMYCSVGYGRHATVWSKPTSMASLLIRSVRPLLSRPWRCTVVWTYRDLV